MIREEATKRICDHLEKYVFDKIWNDPYTEYRTFTVMDWLTTVPTTGVFHGRYGQILLPSEVSYRPTGTTVFFYVYVVPARMFHSLKHRILDWTTLTDFCTNNLIDIEVFNIAGLKCIREGIFLKQFPQNDGMLVAIETSAFKSCFGSGTGPTDDIFFGEMYDSDQVPSIKFETMKLKKTDLPKSGVRSPDYDPVIINGVPTYALYNGKLLNGDYKNWLSAGAFVEKVFDENVVCVVESDFRQVYFNKPTSQPRVLIHIPKFENRERVIITPNTCDVYLVPTKMASGHPELNGIYVYQCGRKQHFHQLTHNDFGIDRSLLDEIAEENGILEYKVRVYVRKLDQTKLAIRDANYVNILYTNSDEEIVKFILNQHEYRMPFWTGTELENGLYDYAVWRRRDTGIPYTIEDYIDLIGYYHTLALVGRRVHYFEVTKKTPGNKEFVVRAPLALVEYGYDDFTAVVYKNGYRVDQSRISIRNGSNADNAYNKELVFTPDATWWTKVIDVCYSQRLRVIVDEELEVGDRVVVEIYDNQKNASSQVVDMPVLDFSASSTQFQLTSDTNFIEGKGYFIKVDGGKYGGIILKDQNVLQEPMVRVIGDPINEEMYELVPEMIKTVQLATEEDWKVYEVSSLEKDLPTPIGTGSDNITFTEVEQPGVFDIETKILTLNGSLEGKQLLVVDGSATFEDVSTSFNISNLQAEDGKVEDDGSTTRSINYLGDELFQGLDTAHFPQENELTFLNSHRLIRGLDYTMEGYTPERTKPGARLYLQNVSYLNVHDNKYQVIRTNQSTLSHQRGFLKGNIVYWNHQNPFWFDELSVLTIDGTVCTDIAHDFGTITLLTYHNAEPTFTKMRKDDPKYLGEKFRPYNGAPFEFRMSVSSRVKRLVGNHGEERDMDRLEQIKAYFDWKYKKPFYQTIVKKAHKIYSLYLEQIISTYVSDPGFDFINEASLDVFEQQFVRFSDWKRRDVCYGFTEEDFKYVDVYPLYNRLQTTDRYQYRKISELVRRLMPTDRIKHKDIHNVK